MKLIDFSNHQNREVRVEDVEEAYIAHLRQCAKQDAWYPLFHIAPPHGLCNDPNGLCQINGTYHIYYQWFPLGPVHGLKHWYHVSTEDFINYQTHGCALRPEDPQDYYGCYSGMSFLDGEDRIVYYTGIDKQHQANVSYGSLDAYGNIQKQGILVTLPKHVSTENFRDPFVWKDEQGYHMLVGGESLEHKGVLLCFHGATSTSFTYSGMVEIPEYPFGYMLECPNYMEFGEQGCLIFSPQGIQSNNRYDFRNVFSVVYMIGPKLSGTTLKATSFYELDKGFDFYAPQLFQNEQGRYMLYAWLGNSKCEYPSDINQWAHMLSIPREVHIVDDRLYQLPLPELATLRTVQHLVRDEMELVQQGYEIELDGKEPFTLFIENEAGEHISFSMTDEAFILDRTAMSHMYNEQYGTVRYAKRELKQHSNIRIFLDTSSIEIFCEDGRISMTARYFLEHRSKLRIEHAQAIVWELKPIELPYPDTYAR